MKGYFKLIFTILSFACFSASCSPTNELSEVWSAEDTMTIAIKQKYVNTKYHFTIIPDSVLYDSRCPDGAQCFWAGDALAAFTLNSQQKAHNIYLHTTLSPKDTTVNKLKIKLIDLSPHPTLSEYISNKNYTVTIVASFK